MKKEKEIERVIVSEEEIEGYAYCDTTKQICLNDCGNIYVNKAYKSDAN